MKKEENKETLNNIQNELDLTGIQTKKFIDASGKKSVEEKRIRSKTDFSAEASRYLRLISDLEIKRKELLNAFNEEDENDKAQKIKTAFDALMGVVPNPPKDEDND